MKIKSIKRIGKRPVYDLSVETTQAYMSANGVMNHNTGIEYNASDILFVSRVQDKDSSGSLRGYNFKLKTEKSRVLKEGLSFDINVSYETGIDRWTGLLPIALETGHVEKPSQGWYSRPGVTDDKKWRAAETSCLEFWKPILTDPTFEEEARKLYCLVNNVLIDDGTDEETQDETQSIPEEEPSEN